MTQATAHKLVQEASPAETRRRRRKVGRRRYLKNASSSPAVPVSETTRRYDPLVHSASSRLGKAGRLALLIGAAFAAHAAALGVFFAVGVLFPHHTFDNAGEVEKVEVRVFDPEPLVEPPQPVPEKPEPEELQPESVTEPEPEPEPKPRRRPEPKAKKRQLAADPIDVPQDAAPEPQQKRRRIVGLSLESTISGAAGPAFAVGNTRMGRTADRAEDPTVAKKVPAVKGERRGGTAEEEPNRVAARIPIGKVEFEKPKRLAKVDLEYPPILKARGVEGNVVVLIRITEEGRVTSAKVLRGSGHDELDRAARTAALRERFAPAKRDGKPVAYTLKYTYRFRIKDA